MKSFSLALPALVMLTAPAFATVNVSVPYNNENVGPAIQVIATANTTTCTKGVASMGVYINDNLVYVQNSPSMNHWLSVGPGWNKIVVQEWDYCGGSTYTAMNVDAAQGATSGVTVTSPSPNSTVGTQVSYVATASTSCSQGVASMGIYVNNNLVYTTSGNQLNHQITLSTGQQHTVVQEWDRCGGSKYQTVNLNVSNPGTTLWNLQSRTNWKSWGEFPPAYDICTSNCGGVGFSLIRNVSSPSYSGHSTQFNLWGSTPYSDALFNLPLLGDNSSILDSGHTLLPTLHHFTYNTDVYVANLAVTQVLEFDIEMDMNGDGMTWGTQCNHLGGGVWDVWDNVNAKWVSIGVPCNLKQGWNHVTLQMQRSSDGKNWLYYQSITLNGQTYSVNRWYAPYQVPGSWWGLGINFQMDGDSRQQSYSTYLDNLSFNYW